MKKRIVFIVMLLSIVSSQIAIADSGVVNTASLRVRQQPSLLSNITGYLLKNAKINTLTKSGAFYKINFNGKTGYVGSSYVTIAKPTSVSVVKSGEITATTLNVRSGAGATYPVTGSIVLGSKVTISETLNGFYKIIYKGKTSYISTLYVKLISGTSTPTSTPSPTGVGNIVNSTSSSAHYMPNGQQYTTTVTGNNIVSYATTLLGMPYVWGGTIPAKLSTTGKYISGGFDCSGLVLYVYKHYGITLPRTSMDQINVGLPININNLKNGDLVFFTTNTSSPSEVSHIGIYIGNNKFIHCPKPGDVVKISELTGYYKENFVIGKRVIK